MVYRLDSIWCHRTEGPVWWSQRFSLAFTPSILIIWTYCLFRVERCDLWSDVMLVLGVGWDQVVVEGGLGMVEACCWRGPGLRLGAVCARCPLLTHPPPIISSILLLTITIHHHQHSLSGDAGGGGGGCSRLCNRDPWTVWYVMEMGEL